MSALPDGWSDCTDQMEDKAPAAQRDPVPGDWHPWLAWIEDGRVTCLDDEDREIECPADVRRWLEEQVVAAPDLRMCRWRA